MEPRLSRGDLWWRAREARETWDKPLRPEVISLPSEAHLASRPREYEASPLPGMHSLFWERDLFVTLGNSSASTLLLGPGGWDPPGAFCVADLQNADLKG